VVDTAITDNQLGPSSGAVHLGREVFVHWAAGGGIRNESMGTLILTNSVVAGNRVLVTAPNGIEVNGGGISSYGRLTVSDSVVRDNVIEAAGSIDAQVNAFAGGIELFGEPTTVIERTTIAGNAVVATNTVGSAVAGEGGISTDPTVTLVLGNSTIEHNTVTASASADGASATAFAGGIELQGSARLDAVRVTGNLASVETSTGVAAIGGGGIYLDQDEPVTLTGVIVNRNRLTAASADGPVFAGGAGLLNAGVLTLRHARLAGNTVEATGAEGFAEGGGLWQGFLSDEPDVVDLTVVDSRIVDNELSGSDSLLILGAGLYSDFPVHLRRTTIAGNVPDDCFGCGVTRRDIGGAGARRYL
jgi:hypothetical protein